MELLEFSKRSEDDDLACSRKATTIKDKNSVSVQVLMLEAQYMHILVKNVLFGIALVRVSSVAGQESVPH